MWIARHGCPITFQSDNGKAFVAELTKELMKRSQVAQAHSTTYHPQTNGLVERQNRTLVSMLRVYCSRYMDDWDKHLPQVMGVYNSTEQSTTIKDAYPIPRIDESLSKLGDAKFFTTLDLGSAFWQVPLRKQDREKTGASHANWDCRSRGTLTIYTPCSG